MMFSLIPEELSVLQLSCKVAASCLVASIIPAICVGWFWHVKTFGVSHSLKHWCFTFSATASGSWLFTFTSFGSRGIIGQYLAPLGIDFAFNWKGAVLASAVMGFPLLVQSIRLAIELVDQRLEMAAKTLGASSLGAFFMSLCLLPAVAF